MLRLGSTARITEKCLDLQRPAKEQASVKVCIRHAEQDVRVIIVRYLMHDAKPVLLMYREKRAHVRS